MNKRLRLPFVIGYILVLWACKPLAPTVVEVHEHFIEEVAQTEVLEREEEPPPPPPPPKPKGKYVRSTFQSNAKGEVHFVAYLPPGWKSNDTTEYPLLIYLYGQGGNEYSFARVVRHQQLDHWINNGDVMPFVLITVRGAEIIEGKSWDKQKIQWYTRDNETMLISEEEGELRDFCRKTFRAGMTTDQIALEGHSRGATGTLYYALKYPEKFCSYLANCYVSDYTLSTLKNSARRNKRKLIENDVPLRMEIGTADFFEFHYGRRGTHIMHDYLTSLKIPHEYDTISGANHHYYYIWYHKRDGVDNGLTHLKFHERAWKNAGR